MEGKVVKRIERNGEGDVISEETVMHEPHSSVELKTDSKGNVNPSVKVYHHDPEEAAKVARRVAKSLGMNVSGGE